MTMDLLIHKAPIELFDPCKSVFIRVISGKVRVLRHGDLGIHGSHQSCAIVAHAQPQEVIARSQFERLVKELEPAPS